MTSVLVDGRIASLVRGGGVLFRRIMPHLHAELDHLGAEVTILVADRQQESSVLELGLESELLEIKPPSSFMHYEVPKRLRRTAKSVLFVPRQTRPLDPRPTVASLFLDVGFLHEPDAYPRNRTRDLTTRWAARMNVVNFAISDYTAEAMRALIPTAGPIVSLPLSATEVFQWEPQTHAPYGLCCAAAHPNKNLERLVLAWEASEIEAPLILVGPIGPATAGVAKLASKRNVELRGFVSDLELTTLMSRCHLYVQPSLYEGLCIPVVNAMASGIPTALSSTHLLGEFSCQLAGAGFDPLSVTSMASTLRALWIDQDLRDSNSIAGRETAYLTDWSLAGQIAARALVDAAL